MFLAPKGDDSYMAAFDFRAVNKKIEIESVPLPDVHSAFHWFSKAQYFTTLDLNQASHQIPLAESSKHITAFVWIGTFISTSVFLLGSQPGLRS
jgi:hypothetical protein